MSMLFCYWGFVAAVVLVVRFVLWLKEGEREEQQRLKKKQQDQEAYFAFHERERERSLVMRVVDNVRRHYGAQQTYEVWRLRWKWDGADRYYWKNEEKFYQLNGKVESEDFTEDDVHVNAYDDEVYTVKYVKGPSRWEISTQSDGKTIVRMIG